MANYRNRETLEEFTGGQIRKLHYNVSFSKVVDTFSDLGYDIIGKTEKPEPSTNLKVVEAGATGNDSDGKPVQVWIERDMFATDDDSTKAEKETAHGAKLLTDRKGQLIGKCKADRDAKTYSNETVAFPVTEHEIKTSNEVDIRNLVSKMLAATAIIQAGGGAGDYKYTTAAKVQVTMTVQQFSTAALSIMAIKDAIFYTYEDLRVLIEAATTTTALDNIVADWPS